ncbi:MAG: hypothetical protein HOE11_04875 [Candidatus Diapherotrites archaeon]|nr:hypothetical protein [Candidatus Diapherotrites archaeon]MBT4596981.1 hypothetical protein [Candidatus Diapherotrites archaeon]
MALVFAIIDFLIYLIPLTIISFAAFKLLSPIKEKLMKKYKLGWIKTCLLINFVISFLCLFAMYAYFVLLGGALAQPMDVALALTLGEQFLLTLGDLARVVIASVILALALLFFEFLTGFVTDLQEDKEYSKTIKQIIAVLISAVLFLLLLFFFFSWAPLGLVVYVFYGGIKPIPIAIYWLL